MKRSTLPFQRGVKGGMRMWRASSSARTVGEGARAAVDERVVGHDRLDGPAALLGASSRRAAQRRGGGSGAVGAVQLDVGQARVVVDDAVRVAGPRRRGRARVSARSPCAQCPGRSKRGELLGVHVQQRARLRPLIAPESSGAALSGDAASTPWRQSTFQIVERR